MITELPPVSAAVEQAYHEVSLLLAPHADSQQIARALISAYQAGYEVRRYEQEIAQ